MWHYASTVYVIVMCPSHARIVEPAVTVANGHLHRPNLYNHLLLSASAFSLAFTYMNSVNQGCHTSKKAQVDEQLQ